MTGTVQTFKDNAVFDKFYEITLKSYEDSTGKVYVTERDEKGRLKTTGCASCFIEYLLADASEKPERLDRFESILVDVSPSNGAEGFQATLYPAANILTVVAGNVVPLADE